MKLTEGCASKIIVPAGKREVVVFDDAQPGFGIRKFADGRAVYFVRYSVFGVRRKLVLSPCIPGVLVSMRRRAAEIMADAKRGADPVMAKKAAVKAQNAAKMTTLGSLAEEYLVARKGELKPRSFEEVARHLSKHWAPLHGRDIKTIARADLVQVIDNIARNSGKTAADRAKASMSTFLGWCLERDYIAANPVGGITRRAPGGSRERVLTESELVAIWGGCHADDYGRIVKLLMLTGQRREEIGGLDWQEVDFERMQIVLPGDQPGLPGRTKNGREHIVPLSDAAARVLDSSPRWETRTLVFGRGVGGFSGWSQSKARLDERLGAAVAAWRMHDLRRTFATIASENDMAPIHVIEAALNHVSGSKSGIVGVYNRASHMRERRLLMDRYGEHISNLVAGSGAG